MNILLFILTLTIIEQLAVDIYLPSFPAMAQYFSTSDSAIQASLSLYLLGFALAPLVCGPICDRIGRRKILLVGLITFCISNLICATTHSIHSLLLARIFTGIGSGAIVVANQSMVRDSFTGVRLAKVASYMSITWSLVPIIAPAVGGYVQHYFGWRANFWLIQAAGLSGLIAVAFYLKETMASRPVRLDIKLVLKRYIRFLSNRHFMAYVACTAITFAVTIAFNTAAPFLLQQQLGLSPVNFGWVALAVGCSYLLGTISNNFLLSYIPIKRLLVAGLILMFLSSIIMLLFSLMGIMTLATVTLPASAVIFFEGLVYPNAAALAFNPITKHTGTASALYSCIQLLACAATSFVMGILPETTAFPLSLVIFTLCCSLCGIYYITTRQTHES